MVYFLLRAFLAQKESQHDTDDGTAEVAFPRNVLQDGQVGNHAPNEAAVEKHHDERNDSEHPVATDETARDKEKVQTIDKRTRSDVSGTWATEAPSKYPAGYIGDEHDAVGESGVAVIQSRAEHKNRYAVGNQVFPTAMEERKGENANQPLYRVGSQAKTPPIKAQSDLDDFHCPHHRNDTCGNDEAPEKLFSLCFIFHAVGSIKNRSAAKVGNFGRKKQAFLRVNTIFPYLCPPKKRKNLSNLNS